MICAQMGGKSPYSWGWVKLFRIFHQKEMWFKNVNILEDLVFKVVVTLMEMK